MGGDIVYAAAIGNDIYDSFSDVDILQQVLCSEVAVTLKGIN